MIDIRNRCARIALIVIALVLALAVTGCGSDGGGDENVFKGQTDAIDKAEQANKMIEEAADAQRRAIEAQGQ